MTETSSKPLHLQLTLPLAGLENIQTYQVRPVPAMTLLSMMNRFLRLEFPPQRDYELCLQLIQKGLLSPQFSRHQLLMLPVKTIEQLAALTLDASVIESPEVVGKGLSSKESDQLLSLILATEETYQYSLSALVSEDLALLEAHQTGSTHGYYFKPSQNTDLLAHVLQSQGYRHDILLASEGHITPDMAYWLCRRLTVVFPWSAVLTHFPLEQAETFPYLYQLYLKYRFVTQELSNIPDDSPMFLLQTLLPQLRTWIEEVFPRFSEEAQVARPIRELVLVEGVTEELLIPAIAKAMGFNLDAEGIFIQAVGGKNQMMQQYVDYAEHLAVPISMILDKDAQSMLPDLAYYQREQDRIMILEEGEFEDIYALELIVKTVNEHYQPHQPLTLKDLRKMDGSSRVKALQSLWLELGLGLFDKVQFAQYLVQTICHERFLSPPMKRLINHIIEAKQHDTPRLPR